MPAPHPLDAAVVHYEWNNAIPPRLVAEPGDTLVIDTRDAADGYYTPASTSRDTAFAKIRARVVGTAMAAETLGAR